MNALERTAQVNKAKWYVECRNPESGYIGHKQYTTVILYIGASVWYKLLDQLLGTLYTAG